MSSDKEPYFGTGNFDFYFVSLSVSCFACTSFIFRLPRRPLCCCFYSLSIIRLLFRFPFSLSTGLIPRNLLHFVSLYHRSSRMLARFDRPPMKPHLLRLYWKSRILSTIFLFSTCLLGLQTVLQFTMHSVPASFCLYAADQSGHLFCVWESPVALCSFSSVLFFRFFRSTFPCRDDFVPCARCAIVILLVQRWF